MNSKEKSHFIKELIKCVQFEILSKVENMPEDWDGHELRYYISQKFLACNLGTLKGKRLKDYKNEWVTRNL